MFASFKIILITSTLSMLGCTIKPTGEVTNQNETKIGTCNPSTQNALSLSDAAPSKYTMRCAFCHGDNGQGMGLINPPIDKSNPINKSHFDNIVNKGVDGSMPSYEGQFTEIELNEMYIWLQGPVEAILETPETPSSEVLSTNQDASTASTKIVVVESLEEEGEIVELEEGEAFDPDYFYEEIIDSETAVTDAETSTPTEDADSENKPEPNAKGCA